MVEVDVEVDVGFVAITPPLPPDVVVVEVDVVGAVTDVGEVVAVGVVACVGVVADVDGVDVVAVVCERSWLSLVRVPGPTLPVACMVYPAACEMSDLYFCWNLITACRVFEPKYIVSLPGEPLPVVETWVAGSELSAI